MSCPVISLHFLQEKGLDMGDKYIYSEGFKLDVIREYESGKFSSLEEARRAYGIGGCNTISNWLKYYGKEHLLSRTIKVTKANEQSETKKLRKRVKELERAVSDSRIEVLIEREYVNILCEEFEVDRNKYKKKVGAL